MNSKLFLKFKNIVFFSWLNQSSQVNRKKSWIKFAKSATVAIMFDLLVLMSVPFGWAYVFWIPLALFATGRLLGRYLVSWRGFRFRYLGIGFFMCDDCRRLDPVNHKSQESFFPGDNRVRCLACFKEADIDRRSREKAKRTEEALKDLAGQLGNTVSEVNRIATGMNEPR